MQSPVATSRPSSHGYRWLWVLLAIAVVAVVGMGALAALATSSGTGGSGWMMGGNWGGMWGLVAIMMLLPFVLLVVLVFALFRPSSLALPVPTAPVGRDPLGEVRLRYARGEITQAQYYQIVSDLERSGPH